MPLLLLVPVSPAYFDDAEIKDTFRPTAPQNALKNNTVHFCSARSKSRIFVENEPIIDNFGTYLPLQIFYVGTGTKCIRKSDRIFPTE